jgi:FtsP/CotA-like multicopper oxidase with cupredoxin domain
MRKQTQQSPVGALALEMDAHDRDEQGARQVGRNRRGADQIGFDLRPPAPRIDLSLETRLVAAEPLRARPEDLVRTILLDGSMKPYSWSMDGEMWPHITPLMVKQGQRVEFELVNHTMMAHPIHLHGHAFQVIAIDGRPIQGAVRDTVLVMPRAGRVRIAFDADNPGRWAFHCHNLYHMQTGMMTEVRYGGIAA